MQRQLALSGEPVPTLTAARLFLSSGTVPDGIMQANQSHMRRPPDHERPLARHHGSSRSVNEGSPVCNYVRYKAPTSCNLSENRLVAPT